jgi:hypothetical protein
MPGKEWYATLLAVLAATALATPSATVAKGSALPSSLDQVVPVIARVALTPSELPAGRGTTIRYALSEPANVTFAFERRAARTWSAVGKLRRRGHAGPNRLAFSGRIGGRPLRAGSYRLLVTAVDDFNNSVESPPRRFRVVD